MPIVIKKRVSLEFLGDEYKEAYLTFKSIPAVDFDEVRLSFDNDKEKNNLLKLLGVLKEYFISGEFPDDGKLAPVTADDLDGLDYDAVVRCFKLFTGQELDPKSETPSTNTSTTVENPQEKS